MNIEDVQVTSGKWMPDVAEFCVRTPISFFLCKNTLCVTKHFPDLKRCRQKFCHQENFARTRILASGEFCQQEARLLPLMWGLKNFHQSVRCHNICCSANQPTCRWRWFCGIVQQNIFSLSFVPQKYVGSILKLSQKWSKIDGGSQQGISKKHQSSGTIASTWLHRLVSKIRN